VAGRGENPPLVLHYVPVGRASSYVTVTVRRTERLPRTCEDARAFFHGHENSYTCQEINGRWVFVDHRDRQSRLVIAVHDNAVVLLNGQVAELAEARLRTVSSRDLAAAPPGRR
jgi:hypothetical protein